MTSISTSGYYQRSGQSLSALRENAERLEAQMSSGTRLTRGSDDPVAASRLRALARADALAKVDESNASRASTDLELADNALSSFSASITRLRELAVQASSGTLSNDSRANIAEEVAQLRAGLVSLANGRDSVGHALFGGETTDNAYSLDASGNAVYAGTASAGEIALGDGQSVTRGITGPEFLNFSVNGTPTDLLAVVKGLADALAGGVADPQAAASDAIAALDTGLDAVTTRQTVVGVRLNLIELAGERRVDKSELRATEENEVGGADIADTMIQLQQAMTVLEASQASFAKLSNLSLFNLLR